MKTHVMNNSRAYRPLWRLLAVCLLCSFVLAGCGGDIGLTADGGGTSGGGLIVGGIGTGGTGVVRASTAEPVADSEFAGAVVFVDKNGNRLPDPDEPFAITDQNGNYALQADAAQITAYPVLLQAIEGKTVVRATGQVVTATSVMELRQPVEGR